MATREELRAGVPLSNQRHELFAQALAQGMTADKAYELAGYRPNRGNATVLKAKQSVKIRVAQLQEDVARRTATAVAIDKAYVLRQSVSLHEAAMNAATEAEGGFDAKAATVAVRALDQIGRHVDVQAFKDSTDIHIAITVDDAISRLERQAVEGDYSVVDDNPT